MSNEMVFENLENETDETQEGWFNFIVGGLTGIVFSMIVVILFCWDKF